MFTKSTKTLLGVLALAAIFTLTLAGPVSASAIERGGPGGSNGSWQSGGTGLAAVQTAVTPLSADESEALQAAILEEYGAYNLYTAAAAEYGSLTPFARIARSEQQHINALTRMADLYGVEIPANPGLTGELDFANLADACQAGVDAEIADAALYDELTPVTTHTDLLRVYDRLQSASLDNHLPAFETCAP